MSPGNVIDFKSLAKDIQELILESIAAREFSYAPYSKFKVGAAIRCEDDTVSRGCNVENASFPIGVCGERTAVVKAVSEGKKKFKAIAVAADLTKDDVSAPCGMCRQTLAEFGDMPIYLTTPDHARIVKTSVLDLLPMTFGLNGHTF